VGVLREILQAFNAATDALDYRDRAQRELVGNVAHDLRTPVAILQAGTESMLDGVTETSRANLISMHEEILRLSARLDDLLSLARASSAALHLTIDTHDMAELAFGAAARLGDVCEASGVHLGMQLDHVLVDCDDQRMNEVITNLLTNALKYTARGGAVTVETGLAGDGKAYLKVSDTGIGIQPDDLPRVTERFFRGTGATSVASGSGIGLTVVNELVRAQDGTLQIASRPGVGTQVTVTIPAASTPEAVRDRR
jgi:signal transduction histidine kinase